MNRLKCIILIVIMTILPLALSASSRSAQIAVRGFVTEHVAVDESITSKPFNINGKDNDNVIASLSVSSTTSLPLNISISSKNDFLVRDEQNHDKTLPYTLTYSSDDSEATVVTRENNSFSQESNGIFEVKMSQNSRDDLSKISLSDTVVITISSR